MRIFNLALLVVAGALVVGCSSREHHGLQLGAPPAPPQGAAPDADSSAILVRGVRVVPPEWFPAGDDAPLAYAIEEYLADFEARLGWSPPPGSTSRHPLTVILHDVQNSNWYAVDTRTAWLTWPRGLGGKPLRRAFAPLLHVVLVYDRRVDLFGTLGTVTTADEAAAILAGQTLPVELATQFPHLYE